MARSGVPVAVRPLGAAGGAVQSTLDGPESPYALNAITRQQTCCSLARPQSRYDVTFGPVVATGFHGPSTVAALSRRNPLSVPELSVQVTSTALLNGGVALAFDGAAGGPNVVAQVTLENAV